MSKSLPKNESGFKEREEEIVRFYVASGHGGGWLVFQEGNPKPVHKVPNKTVAVQTAKIMARSTSPSQVLVEQRDGAFAVTYDFDRNAEQRGY